MELRDMGEESTKAIPDSSREGKYYPTTYLSSKKLPGIEKYDIGDECKIISVNKVVGKREKEDGEVEVEVEIRKSGIKSKVDKDEYDDMSDEDKDKSDEKEVMEDE